MFRIENSTIGVGINYKTEIRNDILKYINSIDLIEVYTEKFFIKDDDKVIEKITKEVPIILHGLDMSLGSNNKLDSNYIGNLKEVLKNIDFEWFSDHISLTKEGDIEVGHLMPVQFSEEMIENIVKKVKQVSALTTKPFLLENITYYYPIPGGNMPEYDFISHIINESDCGILLDVNNLYINSINHKYDAKAFLDKIPLERVVEIHLAGGSMKFGMPIDTHANPIWKEVWELFDYVVSVTKPKGVIIERDANFPKYEKLMEEIKFAREILIKYGLHNKKRRS